MSKDGVEDISAKEKKDNGPLPRQQPQFPAPIAFPSKILLAPGEAARLLENDEIFRALANTSFGILPNPRRDDELAELSEDIEVQPEASSPVQKIKPNR